VLGAEGEVKDAREFFQSSVRNYSDFVQNPTEYRLLESTLLSMDTVPERLALHQLGYPQLSREALYDEARKVRAQSSSLVNLHSCANVIKHSRSISDHGGGKFTTNATSTGIDPADPTTWKIGDHDLVEVVHSAFATLSNHPNLKARP
jgi:hypothetical protein